MDTNFLTIDSRPDARTSLAELLYGDCDHRLNSLSWNVGDITHQDWFNHCTILAFLLCNYSINSSLSNDELSTLLEQTDNYYAFIKRNNQYDMEAYPDLQSFLYPGYTVNHLSRYFAGLENFARKPSSQDSLNDIIFLLEAAIEDIEEEPTLSNVLAHDLLDKLSSVERAIILERDSNA